MLGGAQSGWLSESRKRADADNMRRRGCRGSRRGRICSGTTSLTQTRGPAAIARDRAAAITSPVREAIQPRERRRQIIGKRQLAVGVTDRQQPPVRMAADDHRVHGVAGATKRSSQRPDLQHHVDGIVIDAALELRGPWDRRRCAVAGLSLHGGLLTGIIRRPSEADFSSRAHPTVGDDPASDGLFESIRR